MIRAETRTVRLMAPAIRLALSDGSERSDYLPQAETLMWTGAPHAAINLMASYYPDQPCWPERKLVSPEVPIYNHSLVTAGLEDPALWRDGYSSFVLTDPHNEVIRQIEDVRRHGQDVRLTLTMGLDTPDEDLALLAERLLPFCPLELRVNHESNGCTWFRFSRNVGNLKGEEALRQYQAIAAFFVRAHRVMTAIAPGITFVACYNGPGERATKAGFGPAQLQHLEAEALGAMYAIDGTIASLDQYGSLHYGWPGHSLAGCAPIIGRTTHEAHRSFVLTPHELCELVIRAAQERLSGLRGAPTRLDLGELDFDEDIHGPVVRAQQVYETYEWIRMHPELVQSVTFYELTDWGGLGLLRQSGPSDLDHLEPSQPLLDVYRRVLVDPAFRIGSTSEDVVRAEEVAVAWRSAVDAEGLEITWDGPARKLDLRASYWHRLVFEDSRGSMTYQHGSERVHDIPAGSVKARLFALPPDGRNNATPGFLARIPTPRAAT